MVYLYGPEAIVTLYAQQTFQRTSDSDGLTIGQPIYEAAGVVGRRGLIAHDMTGNQVAYAQRIVRKNGHHAQVLFSDVFPADWRWPVVP